MSKFIDGLKETRRSSLDEEEKKFEKVKQDSFALFKKNRPIKPWKYILSLVLYLFTLAFVSVSLASLVDVSTSAYASQIDACINSEGKGYTYGRLVPTSTTVDYRSFQSLAPLVNSTMVNIGDAFIHSQPDDDYTPFITTNEDYSEQLSPHIVMPYRFLYDNFYGFSLLSGEAIEQIWTPSVYVTQAFADELIAVDSDLKADYDKEGYEALIDYEISGIIDYWSVEARDFAIRGVIDSSSLGKFADINGGSFIYCSFDASYWCFGKPCLEFFLHSNEIDMASYLSYLGGAMAAYGNDFFDVEFYNWNGSEFVLGSLQQQYLATENFYNSRERIVVGVVCAVLALVCFGVFNFLTNRIMEEDYTLIAVGRYMPIPIALITMVVAGILFVVPNFVFNNVLFCLHNYMSITFVILIGLLVTFTVAFFTAGVYKDEMAKIKRGTNSVTSLVEGVE